MRRSFATLVARLAFSFRFRDVRERRRLPALRPHFLTFGLAVWSVLATSRATAQPAATLQTAVFEQSVSVASGWGINLAFTAPSTDTAGFWSAGAPTRLTVPAGVTFVQVGASITLDATCTVCMTYVMKNDAEVVAASYGATADTGFGASTFTALAPVVAVSPGDFFTVRVFQNTGLVTAAMRVSIAGLNGAGGAAPSAAHLDQSASVVNGWGEVSFAGAPVVDTAGWWSVSQTTRLTVPAGVHDVAVSASVVLSSTCTICEIYVLKNNSTVVATSYGATADTGFGAARFSVLAPVVAVTPGDYFTIGVYQNTGATVSAPVRFSVLGLEAPGIPFRAALLDQSVAVANGWGPALSFSASSIDTGALWTATSPTRLTVPAAVHFVQVAASVALGAGCSVCDIYVVKNDAVVVATSYGATANTGLGSAAFNAVAPVVPVTAGDYFTVRVYQNTGAAVTAPVRFSVVGLDRLPLPPAVVTANTVTPGVGAGLSQTFSLQYGDTAGALDLSAVWVSFDATGPSHAAHSCLVSYLRATNTLALLNDAGTQFAQGTVGGTGTLHNSQCTIALGGSSATILLSSTALTLNLAVSFSAGYAGPSRCPSTQTTRTG